MTTVTALAFLLQNSAVTLLIWTKLKCNVFEGDYCKVPFFRDRDRKIFCTDASVPLKRHQDVRVVFNFNRWQVRWFSNLRFLPG